TYSFQLVVSDGVNLSLPATVSVTVKTLPTDVTFTVTPSDGPGIVNGQAVLSLPPNPPTQLTFDVTTSDTSPNFWFFYWDQLAGPSINFNPLYYGSPNSLTFPSPGSPITVGYYKFQVRATTHNAIVAQSTISVVVNNPGVYTVPVASPGPAQTATAGQTVTLDATGSTATAPAVFGSGLRAFWTQTGGPPVVLSNPYAVQPTFTPPAAGTYSFSLTVSDATSPSAPGTVTVTVQPAPAAPVAQGGGGGGCGLGGELVVLLPLIWGASWLMRSRTKRRGVSSR
ncbi:MAG TPA: hypothetical protein VG457_17285, partial [Planctomycetota bacterium]|nr:hypothetical protein [Planctomycetota bacterium]